MYISSLDLSTLWNFILLIIFKFFLKDFSRDSKWRYIYDRQRERILFQQFLYLLSLQIILVSSQYFHEKSFEISTLIYASIYKYCIQHSCPKFATSQNSYYNDVVYLFFKNLKMEEKEKVDRIGVQRLYCHNWSGRKVSISTVVNNDPPFDAGCPCDSSYFVILLP